MQCDTLFPGFLAGIEVGVRFLFYQYEIAYY